MNTESTSLGILYVQPVCFPAESDTAETLVLHFEWQTSQRSTASAQVTTSDSSRAAVFQEPAVGGQPWPPADSCKGHLRSSSTHGSRQDGVPQPVLQGMLFHGSQCLAQYSWPLPGPQEAAQVVTAVAALPVMVQPCVLELVLACPTVAEAAATTSRRPSGSRSGRSSAASPPPSVTRCSIVFLPPAAVQEVQQQLLPAMQQEVLEAWAATAAGAAAKGRPGGIPLPLLQAVVWQHWQALADDLGLVLGLGQRAFVQEHQEDAAEDVSGRPALPAAAQPLQINQRPQQQQQQQQQQQEWGDVMVTQCVLPHMLSFLTNWGLRHMTALVQHAARDAAMPHPAVTAAAGVVPHAVPVPACPHTDGPQAPADSQSCSPFIASASQQAQPAAHLADTTRRSHMDGDGSTQDSGSSSSSSSSSPHMVTPAGQEQEVGGAGTVTSGSSSSRVDTSSKQQQQPDEGLHPTAVMAPQQSLPQLGIRTCWRGFPSPLEQQYVQYKHRQYLWLDRYAACYALLRFCVLLVRMVPERDWQGSMLYITHVMSKGAPYLLLFQGHTLEQYQRGREVLLGVVSPALCLAPIVVKALLADPVITPLLIQGCSGALAWCQQHGGRLLQWWALLLAHWPQLAVVGQLPGAQQLAVATAAAAAALNGLPEGGIRLHEYMKTVFIVPTPPLRSFWRVYGEYLVLLPISILRHARMWYFAPSTLAEVAGNCYVFSWVAPWWQVVLRFTPALLLTIALAWWFDWWVRGKFVGHLQHLEEQRAQQLAEKLQGLGEDD